METTALGAAYLAGRKAGVWPDLDGFAATWRLDRSFEPRMDEANARAEMERLAGSRAAHIDAAVGRIRSRRAAFIDQACFGNGPVVE